MKVKYVIKDIFCYVTSCVWRLRWDEIDAKRQAIDVRINSVKSPLGTRKMWCNAPVRQRQTSDGPSTTKTTKRKAADGTGLRSVRLSLLRLNVLAARSSSDP